MPTGPRPAPPVGTARVAISGNFDTAPWTNVFHLKLTSGWSPAAADLKNVIDAMITAWATRFASQLPNLTTQTDAKAVWIESLGGEIAYEGSYSHVGSGGTGLLNAASAPIINWSINAYYRGGHPRTYLGGLVAAFGANATTLQGSAITSIAAAANGWLADVNALTHGDITGVQLGCVSFARNNAWRVPPVFIPYNNASVRPIFGTQRRRLGGR